MNSLFKNIEEFIRKHDLFDVGQTVVVGLSGGPDSVFLLQYMLKIKQAYCLHVIAAHLDHEWRESSKDDAAFCAQLCAQWQVPLISMRASQLNVAIKQTGSKEDVGRQLRRALFESVRHQYGAHAIVLAHHADDQLETFFMRLVRGATVAGLAGMRPRDGYYVRPLLCVHKKDILAYVHEQKISYVIDPTNESDDYLRNRIRKQLLPRFNALDNRACTNTLKAIDDLQQTDAFLQNMTQRAYQSVCCLAPAVIDIKKLCALEPLLQRRVIVMWLCSQQVSCMLSGALIEEIMRFLCHAKSTAHCLGTWTVVKKSGHAHIVLANAFTE